MATEKTAKAAIQEKVEYWIGRIKDLSEELDEIEDRDSKEFSSLARVIAEYKGRIYAMRSIDDVLGYGIETNFQ